MKFTIHVPTIEDIADARAYAAKHVLDGDEIEIIVAQPTGTPAEVQPMKQAVADHAR